MKKIISLIIVAFILSSCSFFQIHKMDIEQGNVITQEDVSRLHLGMSEAQVREIMGSPILVNLFTPNRLEYVYTVKKGHGNMAEQRMSCLFQNGRLKEILH